MIAIPRRGRLSRPTDVPGQFVFAFMHETADETTTMPLEPLPTQPPDDADRPPADRPATPITQQAMPPARLAGQRQRSLLDRSAGTYEAVRRVKIARFLCALMAGAAVAWTALAVVIRLVSPDAPAAGSGAMLVADAVLSVLAFAASLIVIQALMPKPREGRPLHESIAEYCKPCYLGVAVNAAAVAFAGVAVLAAGLRDGLWLPLAALALLNGTGLALAWPRMSAVRKLHYSPSLPYAQV